mgnify:CR=1 FL=1
MDSKKSGKKKSISKIGLLIRTLIRVAFLIIDFNSENVSVFPLATPIIAGPAAITSVIVSVSDMGSNFTNQSVGMIALVSVLFLTFMFFFTASKFSQMINKKVISVISRVIAIILVGLSVQYILDGIKTFLA